MLPEIRIRSFVCPVVLSCCRGSVAPCIDKDDPTVGRSKDDPTDDPTVPCVVYPVVLSYRTDPSMDRSRIGRNPRKLDEIEKKLRKNF